MSFVRPEITALLTRWREAIGGVILFLTGAWWAVFQSGPMVWIGAVLALIGMAIVYSGVQRGRFRNTGDGPGMIRIDEGQITYFGPLTGGMIALSDVIRIELDRSAKPAHWKMVQSGYPPLFVPVTADGADALFDAFAALPGFNSASMLAEMKMQDCNVVVIWQKHNPPLH